MEELAPQNAYHARWAVDALLDAQKAKLPLEDYAAYAQDVLSGHCGPGALEVFLGRSKSLLEGLDLKMSRRRCPGEIHFQCHRTDETLEVQVDLPLALKVADIEISSSRFLLDLRLKSLGHFLLALPHTIDPEPPQSVRLLGKGRKLRAHFKII